MRANRFTFKKTKRVKVVTEHTGVCLDLTTDEAKDLCLLVGSVLSGLDRPAARVLFDDIYYRLSELLGTNGAFPGSSYRVIEPARIEELVKR